MTLLMAAVIGCGDDHQGAAEGSSTTAAGSTTDGTTAPDEGTSGSSGGESTGADDLPAAPQSVDETVAIYVQAWSELDLDRRRALLELVWADDGVYRDPTVVAEGREALAQAIGAFQQGLPGSTLVPVGAVDAYGTQLRFEWAIEGPSPLPGMDVGELDDELRLVRITGFFGELATSGDVPPAVQAYADAWNEPDAMLRLALLADAVTDGVVYRDPSVEVAGIDALSEHIGAAQAMFGGAELTLTSAVDAYGEVLRYGWAIGPADAPSVSGLDMAVVADDGRLVEVNGFFDD